MAISASGLYLANIIDMADSTQLALDFSLATHRLSLIGAAATPNFDTDVSWNTTNEVAGTGWLTPGVLLSVAAAGPASTVPLNTVSPTGTWMYDMTDVAVASTTISNASAVRLYADALAADNLILLINFTAPFSTFNGTFGIQFATTGVFALDLTP
jgi:hypothetical protein